MTTNKIEQTLIIPDEHRDERLDQALAKLLPAYSRTQIKEWIDSGMITIAGKTIKAKTKMMGGEEVTIAAELKVQPVYEAQDISLNIVYEDEDVLIINKPCGLIVHPGAGNQNNTLLNALLFHAPELKNLPRAGILHRLDKETTGLLVIAKNPMSLKNLSHQLKQRSLVREYQAIVAGKFISGGTVNAPIARHHTDRKRMAVTEDGKTAITHYRVMDRYRAHTRLRVKLETGRTHQIRVHMAHIRHPIVGDKTYGGRLQLAKGMSEELIHALRNFNRQALHAFAIEIEHPTTHGVMRFETPLPEDMQKLIHVLERDIK